MTDRNAIAAMAKRLIVSIHDVAPPFAEAVELLVDRLVPRLGASHLAMLVVPRHWAGAPLSEAPAFARRIRSWADAGFEIMQHGWTHRDDCAHRRGIDRWRARRMTAGEGEFLGLSKEEAGRRLREGRAMIEDAVGRPVTGFVAPAWLYGPGVLAALRSGGRYRIAEDHFRVWDPVTGRVLARGPVITWASRSRARQASSLAVAGAARVALHGLPVVRVAVHPGDVANPRLLASIDATVTAFAARRSASGYRDLLETVA